MTEAEWRAATDPSPLIDWSFFDARTTDRKLRLFSVACCEPLRHLVGDPAVLSALNSAEEFADGRIDFVSLASARATARGNYYARLNTQYEAYSSDVRTAEIVCLYPTKQDPHRDRESYRAADDDPYSLLIARFIGHPHPEAHFPRLVRLLHDIFGPLPFREVSVEPAWLTADVLALARGIYDEKAFDRMPILADALQDAGCANDEMLAHCRQANWEHVRGCWVLDLLLGRPWRQPLGEPGA